MHMGGISESVCGHADLSALKPVTRLSAAWLIVNCLACDFLMIPAFSLLRGGSGPNDASAAFAFGIVGCVFAQGNLLAAWLAWGEGPFLRRLATHWFIAAGLYLVWLVGLAFVASRIPDAPEIARTVALGVPLVSIAAQFPLWSARQWLGWRLVKENAGPGQPSELPLAIRDLMVATIIVAGSLALARLSPTPEKRSELWTMWTVFFIAASVISSISLLPAGAILMRGQPFSRRLAWASLYAASLISLPWVVVFVVWWYGTAPLPARALCVGLSSLMFTFASTVVLTAAIARDRGYRLAWGRRRPAIPAGKVPSEGIRVMEFPSSNNWQPKE
jgi:hypothetical protein